MGICQSQLCNDHEFAELEQENPGTLTMSLDNLRLKELSDGTADVEFIGIKTNVYGESVPVVPFEFVFTPGSYRNKRLKKAILML